MTQERAAVAEEIFPVRYLVTEEMIDARDWTRGQRPFYRVEELAKFFFGMSASWLRLKLKADETHPDTWFVENGRRMEFRRNDPERGDSSRVFTLADVQPMLLSLFGYGAIDATQVGKILRIVEAEAILYGLIDVEPDSGNGS